MKKPKSLIKVFVVLWCAGTAVVLVSLCFGSTWSALLIQVGLGFLSLACIANMLAAFFNQCMWGRFGVIFPSEGPRGFRLMIALNLFMAIVCGWGAGTFEVRSQVTREGQIYWNENTVTSEGFLKQLSYQGMVRRDFGTPEAIAELTELYQRIEREMSFPAYPTGLVPRSWMPDRYAESWGKYYAFEGRVAAQYDAEGRVVALWFEGSRNGCVVTKKPFALPSTFGRSFPLATEPLHVTGWVSADLR